MIAYLRKTKYVQSVEIHALENYVWIASKRASGVAMPEKNKGLIIEKPIRKQMGGDKTKAINLDNIEVKAAEQLIEKGLAEYKDGRYHLTKLGLKVYTQIEIQKSGEGTN